MVRLGDVCEKGSSSIAQKDLDSNDGEYPIYGAAGLIKLVDFYKQENPYIAIVKDGAGIGRTMILPAKSSVIGTMQYIIPNNQIDTSYLFYVITYMNLAKYYTGATIPHIYFKDYQKEMLPLPPIDEQKRIAKTLDLASEIVKGYKEQLAELDKLEQSVFYEMFGESKTNPMQWTIKKLGEIAKVGSSKRVFTDELVSNGVPFYRGTEIGALATKRKIKAELFIAKEHYDELCKASGKPTIGDLLMPSICDDGRIWRVDSDEAFYFKDGRVLWIHFDRQENDDVYMQFALKEKLINDYNNIASGTTFAELKIFALKNVDIMLPPLPLQTRFAAIVTAIESQKAQVQQALTEAENLFNSLMQEYFE